MICFETKNVNKNLKKVNLSPLDTLQTERFKRIIWLSWISGFKSLGLKGAINLFLFSCENS